MDVRLNDTTEFMEANAGDGRLPPELFERIYGELRQLAVAWMRKERADHTLQTTALVAEAYLRLTGGRPLSWREEAAATLAVSAKTVNRDWEFARVWLEKRLRKVREVDA